MTKLPQHFLGLNAEEVSKKELFKSVDALVGKCQRSSLEYRYLGVYRVDKGSYCNTVLGFWVYADNVPTKYYVVRGLIGLEKYKIEA